MKIVKKNIKKKRKKEKRVEISIIWKMTELTVRIVVMSMMR